MLSAKPWKTEAVIRLLLSIIVCFFAGSLVVSWLHEARSHARFDLRFISAAAASLCFLAATLALMRRPWNFESSMKRIVVLVSCLYAGLCLGALAQQWAGPLPSGISVGQMLIATLSFQGATVLLIAWLLREHQVGWREAFGFVNHWHRAVMFGLLIACIFLPIASVLQRASAALMSHLPFFPIKPEEQPAIQTLRIATSWFDRLALGIVTILLAPVAEELLFRGVLYPWIKLAGFPRLAVWGTSIGFAAIHGKLVVFLPLMVLALLLTALYEKTNNLLAPITAHASFNAANFAMLYLLERQT
jgi:membrane protease YdiL (CAAX protease family)